MAEKMDPDFMFALRLQQEMDKEDFVKILARPVPTRYGEDVIEPGPKIPKDTTGMSLVDETWEYLDPNPDVRALFIQYNDRFFWGKLAGVEVRWSPRMTLCAGLCCYEGRGGLCSVRLSQPLLKLRHRKDLVETLLHEMIHAYLFVTENNKDHDGHGPEFHKHMHRINKEAGTGISVYHNFHDEVDHHRQHWWRCNGPCTNRPPYFGFVKRAMNRPPHPRDPWWPDHERTCGGVYTKVKEPENYKKKKENKEPNAKKDSAASENSKTNTKDIRKFFGGKSDTGSNVKTSSTSSSVPSSKTSSSTSGSRIVTISSPSSSEEGESGRSKPAEFPGKGFSLEKIWKDRDSESDSNKIVRKLPGIGVIETQRPSASSSLSSSTLPSSDSTRPSSSSLSSSTLPSSESTKRKHFTSSDSDSETDDILEKLRAKAKSEAKKPKVKQTTLNLDKSSSGRGKKMTGFRSVSGSKISEEGADDISPTGQRRSHKTRGDKSPDDRRRGYKMRDRDKRALGVDSDVSDSSGDDENLGDVIKKRPSCNTDPDYSPCDDQSSEGRFNNKTEKNNSRRSPHLGSSTSRIAPSDSPPSRSSQMPTHTQPSSINSSNPSRFSGRSSPVRNPSRSDWSNNNSSQGRTSDVNPPGAKPPATISLDDSVGSGDGDGRVWTTVWTESDQDPMRDCPACTLQVKESEINAHLDICLQTL